MRIYSKIQIFNYHAKINDLNNLCNKNNYIQLTLNTFMTPVNIRCIIQKKNYNGPKGETRFWA